MLSVKLKRDDGFHVDLEDYLMGLLQLASELVGHEYHSVFCLAFEETYQHCTQLVKKNSATIHLFITNVGRFSKFFHCHILQEICNKTYAIFPTTP